MIGWNLGITQSAIAGILGNMQSESGIVPDIWESGQIGDLSVGYGLVQWTPASKFINWAQARGLDYTLLESQMQRIRWEIENNQQWIRPNQTFLQWATSVNDAYTAGIDFLTYYERPYNPNQPWRGTQAQEWYTKGVNNSWGDGGGGNPGGGEQPLPTNAENYIRKLSDTQLQLVSKDNSRMTYTKSIDGIWVPAQGGDGGITPQPPTPLPPDTGYDDFRFPDQWLRMTIHFTAGRWQQIRGIVLHHNGGIMTGQQVFNTWQTRQASAHYQVENNGLITQFVELSDTAWHAGDANSWSIGIEHSNNIVGEPWTINNTVLTRGSMLVAALCIQFNLGRPEWNANVYGHSQFMSTRCPGAINDSQNVAYMNSAKAFYDSWTS